ncbi:hypothetical protein [Maribacter antarcticus]|uniref:hypothetical protein n=1 Tax=Maribacter antarcticus TaxID=505250 RepID=UPI00047EE2F1|nr:hypothetical protein [Maribacter antarcticus]
MKKILLYIFFGLTTTMVGAQELFRLTFEQNQTPINTTLVGTNEISLPVKGATIIVGGVNDLDGMGNYLNIYGSKLIVDSLDIASDGTQNVVLRREDGNNFFNLYSTMRAKLTPVRNLESKSILEVNIIP